MALLICTAIISEAGVWLSVRVDWTGGGPFTVIYFIVIWSIKSGSNGGLALNIHQSRITYG